jgi:putative FmdB family regulatory protein
LKEFRRFFMPTYEYKCTACGHAFERFQSMSAEPIKRCPQCGKAKVKRLIGTGAGLIFKGSGFYITDYRDAGYKEKAKAESGDGAAAKSDAKSDAKSGGEAAGAPAKSDAAPSTGGDAKPAAPKPETKSAAPKSEGKSSRKKDRS